MLVDIFETSNQEYHMEVKNVVFLQGEAGTNDWLFPCSQNVSTL